MRSEVIISEEPDKTDFFMVLEGNCYINVKVKITFDQSDSLRYIPLKEGAPEHSVASGANDEYARKHHSIPDTFTAKFLLPRFAIINDETVSKYYIDFHQLFIENPNFIEHVDDKKNQSPVAQKGTPIMHLDEGTTNQGFKIVKPIIENYPTNLKQKVLRYDIEPNQTTISGALGNSFAIRIPSRQYMEVKSSYWCNYHRYQDFMHMFVPHLKESLLSKQLEMQSMFKEMRFYPNQTLLHEDTSNECFYLIAEGFVRLECMNNPFRRMEYNKESMLTNMQLHEIYDKSSGAGAVSHTFNKSNLGIVTTGSWIGEESCILRGEVPQVYTAVAVGEVKAFALNCDDFMNKFPSETKV